MTVGSSALTRQAGDVVARKKTGERGQKVRVQVGDVEVSLRLPGGGPGLPQEEWMPFSPTEGRILELLLASGPLSREEIAQKLDESTDGRIKGILAGLNARHVLRIVSDGYEINAPAARRKAIREWLARAGGTEEEPAA